MSKIRLVVLFLFFPTLIFSQAFEEEQKVNYNPSPLSSISIQSSGMIMDASFEAQLENFKKLAPESEILKQDLSGYSKDISFYDQQSGAFGIYVDFPLAWEMFEFLRPKIRIGLVFMNYGALNYNMSKTDYFRIDTLTNSGGERFFVDSTSLHHIEINYSQEQLMVDAGIMFSSNEKSRWCVKGGFTLALGFTHAAGTRIIYDRTAEYNLQLPGIVYPNDFYKEEETFRNNGSFVGMASIPFILDFRIARKSSFFSRCHLYTEVRPFLYYTSIPEINNQSQSGFGWGIGLSYEI